MDRHLCYKLLKALSASFFGCSLLLSISSRSWALECPSTMLDSSEVRNRIQQLKEENLEQQLEKVNKWSNDLYPLLEESNPQNHSFCSLIGTLKEPTLNPEVRNNAAYALRGIGTGAEDAIPILKELLINPDEKSEIRQSVIWAIRGVDASYAVQELVDVLDDRNAEVSSVAAEALLGFRNKSIPRDKGAVPILTDLLQNNPNSHARSSAAKALGQIAPRTPTLVAELNQALQDPSWVVRKEAADALGRIAQDTSDLEVRNALKETIPNLHQTLDDKNYTMRSYAIAALRSIGISDPGTLDKLRTVLNSDPSALIRGEVALTLGNVVAEGKNFDEKSFESLIAALPDQPEKAAEALVIIADSLPEKVEQKQISLDQALTSLEKALPDMKDTQYVPKETVEQVELQKAILTRLATVEFIVNDLLKNLWFWTAIVLVGSYGGIFWLRPLWLLKLDEGLLVLEAVAEVKNPVVSGVASILKIALRCLSPLTYHSRVLNAWVLTHLQSVREEFQEKDTVRERQVYVPGPVILNDRTTVPELTGKELQKHFTKHKQMLIWGEGGAGKTSLACKIAKWGMSEDEDERLCQYRMLPVLIEEDLAPEAAKGKCPFTAAILGQLNDELGEETSPISETLFEKLLKKRRILVIVDHLSEMSEQTRQLIRPEMPECPVKALVITSRIRESLGHLTKTTIQPLRIEGNRLSSFMDNYLMQLGKRELFTDEEFFNHCRQLSRIAGQGNITALLARLYADQMINAKEKSARAFLALVADNIPDLMLSYLNTLNRDIQENKLDDRKVHQAAKIVAWECLKETYKPTTAMREELLKALGDDEAEQQLEYLEKRLHLIQTVGPAQDRIRFALDPIAEYLAAWHLIEFYRHNEGKWTEFLQQFDSIPEDFLRALRDCCDAKGKEAEVPNFIIEKLSQINGKTIQLSQINGKTIGV